MREQKSETKKQRGSTYLQQTDDIANQWHCRNEEEEEEEEMRMKKRNYLAIKSNTFKMRSMKRK